MLQHLEANDFIKCPSLPGQIVEIASFEAQPRRIRPLVRDQEVLCFLHLLLLVVHGHNARSALVGQPGEIPIPAASVKYVSGPGLPETAQRSTITSV